MRKLIFISLLSCISNYLIAQTESHVFSTYDTSIVWQTDAFHSVTYICTISRPTNMFTVGSPDTASRPAIITMPGVGEMGTNAAKTKVYGPHYWLLNGWDGGVVLGNGKHYPILITMICSYTQPDPAWNLGVLNILLSSYHIKRNSVHLAGLSQGAFTWSAMITYEATPGGEDGMKPVTSLTLLSGAAQINPPGYAYMGHWAKKYKGKAFITVGPGDAQAPYPPLAAKAMNDSVNGSAYFAYNTVGGGTHCCWNTEYDPSITNWQSFAPLGTWITTGTDSNSRGTYKIGSNLFQWMLRQGDTTLVGSTQISVKKPILMEYWHTFVASNDTIYGYVNASTLPVAMPLPGARKVQDAAGCFNKMRVTAQDGTIWESSLYNAGSNTWSQIINDTTGATINDATFITGYADCYIFGRSDGSLWYAGLDSLHIFYSPAQFMQPTQISPAGLSFKKARFGAPRIVGLTTAGQVYEWIANSLSVTPSQKTIPRPAIDIAVSSKNMAIALIPKATGSQIMGYPYVWGTNWGNWGETAPGHTYAQPTDISTLWNVTQPLKQVSLSSNSTHWIDSSGRAFGVGFNAQGEVGNGQEFVNRYTYLNWPHLGWDFNQTNPVIAPGVQINGSIPWVEIYDNNFFVYYKAAKSINGDIYTWGRGKVKVLYSGVYPGNTANASDPNNYDFLSPTLVTPLTKIVKDYTLSLSNIGAGNDQVITTSSTTISVTGSPELLVNGIDTVCCRITNIQWMQTAGASGVTITNANSTIASLSGLTTGVYRFRVQTTDNNQGMDTASLKVTVNIVGTPPTVIAGIDQTITQPASGTSLAGTVIYNGGATANTTTWSVISAPGGSSPVITSPSTLSTAVTGLLVVGVYTFQLSATDSNNNTSTDQVTVTIIAAPPPTNGGFYILPKRTILKQIP